MCISILRYSMRNVVLELAIQHILIISSLMDLNIDLLYVTPELSCL